MKLISIAVLLVLCTATQAVMFSTIATVSLTLISLSNPVSCFFGIFRRRKSPPIQEVIPEPQTNQFFPNLPMSGGMFNPFSGFGAGGMFHPGLNNPQFGMFGNRFPPQVPPPKLPPMRQGNMPQMFSSQQAIPQHVMQQFPPQPSMQRFPSQQMPQMSLPPEMSDFPGMPEEEEETPGMNTEEAESFFTLLSETDESKCISRLICEMGANPDSGGAFGQTIVEVIGSLKDFPVNSKVSEYNEILNIGLAEGLSSCLSKFSVCDEESYQLVKKAQLDDDGQGE